MLRSLSRLSWVIALLASLGCQTKVILVPSGDPVLLAEPIRVKVYAFDAQGNLSGPAKVKIPAGWYALPKAK
jgi:hypothetical protein